ncbi:MAG: hypothetical protein IK096_01285, partial [Lachnospiraceae bacterium]|nr:hypothetical protein [Lachnospiraceae bacterium]
GPDIEYQGIPYYLEQMSEFARLFAGEVNDIMHRGYPAERDEHGLSLLTGTRDPGVTAPSPFAKKDEGQVVADAMPQYTDEEIETIQRVTKPGTGAGSGDPNDAQKEQGAVKYMSYADQFNALTAEEKALYNNSVVDYFCENTARVKGCTYLTAGNFAISDTIKSNANLLATRLDVTEGVDEMRALSELYKMCSTKEIFRGATSGEYLDKVLGDVSLNASNSQTNEDTFKSLEVTITNQRNSVMGVDEDEEAANLVKYQNSYTLASKMIQTLTEIYDRLINQTGV